MGIMFLFLVYFMLGALETNAMSLKGPVMTRYDPCGLGMIQFNKLGPHYWSGAVYFGIYANLIEAELVLVFKDEVTISTPQNIFNTVRRTNKRDLLVNVVQPIPNDYTFYVTLDDSTTNENDVPIVDTVTLNNVTLCNDEIKASQTIRSLNVTNQYGTKYAHVCGRRSIEHEELMSVRTEANAGDWPWHVAILVTNKNNVPKYQCGGNIVSKTAIVTAGHCVAKNGVKMDARRVTIVAGINNLKDVSQPGIQTFIAQEIIVHPAHEDTLATADLAIIKVNGIEFTEYVQPICLWGPVYDKTNLYGKEAMVVGFGATEKDKQSDILRSTYIRVQNDTTCVAFSPKLYARLLNEFTFCAGYGPSSSINSRNGDSGGGLVVSTVQPDHKISWFLRGVLSKCGVSPGHIQCDPKYYVVYTDVAPHYSWIYHHAGLVFRNNVMVS